MPSSSSDDQVIVASSSQSEVVFCATIYWKREVRAQSCFVVARFVSCRGCIFVQSWSLLPPANVSDFRWKDDTAVSVLVKILICFDKLWHSITISRRDKTPPCQNLATQGREGAMNPFFSDFTPYLKSMLLPRSYIFHSCAKLCLFCSVYSEELLGQ